LEERPGSPEGKALTLIVLGGLLSVIPRRRGNKSEDGRTTFPTRETLFRRGRPWEKNKRKNTDIIHPQFELAPNSYGFREKN